MKSIIYELTKLYKWIYHKERMRLSGASTYMSRYYAKNKTSN